jgi:AcrR family transcriptional regulator
MQTRNRIAITARRLFAERGFDMVTVLEIAEAADVSEQTVYNHFPTKEDLVFWRSDVFEAEMIAIIEQRAPGESVLDAFERFVRIPRGALATADSATQQELTGIARVIVESPSLLAREHAIYARLTDALATYLRSTSTGQADDARPWVAANAMIGAHRAVLERTRRLLIEEMAPVEVARAMESTAIASIKLLADGLSEYGG